MRHSLLGLTFSIVSLAACTQSSDDPAGNDASTGHLTDSSVSRGANIDASHALIDASNLIVDASTRAIADAEPIGPNPDGGPQACRAESDCPGQLQYCFDVYGTCGPVSGVGEGCTSDSQCSSGFACTKHDGSAVVCDFAETCTDDTQCTGGRVCTKEGRLPFNDPTSSADSYCLDPCASDSDCAPTDKCDGAGHCRPRTCAECPSYFSCATGTCVISTCTADADCPGGHCVNDRCQEPFGTCGTICF